jgi:hypothetical protein
MLEKLALISDVKQLTITGFYIPFSARRKVLMLGFPQLVQ